MAFIIRRGKQYFKIQSYRNQNGQPRQRILERLGTQSPRGPHRGLRAVKVRDGNGE